jgi:excisionase family DNA binding protein
MNDTRANIRPRYMNVREAAEFLRIAPKTLYGLVSQRRCPFRKAGRRLLFLESELIEWTRPAERKRRLLLR